MKKAYIQGCWLLLLFCFLSACKNEVVQPAPTQPVTIVELLPLQDEDYALYILGNQAYGERLNQNVTEDSNHINALGNSRTITGMTIFGVSNEQREELLEILRNVDLSTFEAVNFHELRKQGVLSRAFWMELVKGENVIASLRFYLITNPENPQGQSEILIYVNGQDGELRCFRGEAFNGVERLCEMEEEIKWDCTFHEENATVTVFSDPEGRLEAEGIPKRSTRERTQYFLSLLEWELRRAEEAPQDKYEETNSVADVKIELCNGSGVYWVDLENSRIITLRKDILYTVDIEEDAMTYLRMYISWADTAE